MSADLTETLTETLAAMREHHEECLTECEGYDALLSAVENVLTLHQSSPNSVSALHPEPQCRGCFQDWPCETVRALSDALGGAQA